jgi:hypothetical protein
MDVSWLALLFAIIIAVRVWDLPKRLASLQEELARRQAEQNKLQAEVQRLRDQLADLLTANEPLAVPAVPRPAVAPVPAGPVVAPAPAPTPPVPAPAERPTPAIAPVPAPASIPVPAPQPVFRPAPVAAPSPVAAAATAPAPAPVAAPPVVLPPAPPRRPVPAPKPVPTGPTFWERAATVLLENWTGILGAVVLVTGVGFLGIYTALRMAPPYRFLLICAFAGGLLGGRWALREKAFARQLNGWLLSSAAAIFLFACVGAVSIPGLRWVSSPFDYLLLLAGVSVNLYLAWRTSRQEISTLHGVLSLVALAVLPPTALTLGAAAGVTAFSIAITYRQQWRYQLLLSIVSFFAFHLYWHHQLPAIGSGLRLAAMGLVLLVGGVAAVVQYRRVYARRRFEPLLFAAHLLNWTCLGINLYLYSTGSAWKTIPLALGAGLTFWAGRRARQLGIGWLFQTDSIISLMLALGTALSLQGWHATPTVIGLFMLLESLLVALIMARQSEALVYRVAMAGALLAGTGLLLIAGTRAPISHPATLYRDALLLVLAGWAGLAFVQFIFRQPLLLSQLAGAMAGAPAPLNTRSGVASETADKGEAPKKTSDESAVDKGASDQNIASQNPADEAPAPPATESHRHLLSGFAGLTGLLQAGAGLLLARALFAWAHVPVVLLLVVLVALAGAAIGLAHWVRAAALAPDWVRRQQLVLGQFLAVLAVFGLHELGLSWPLVLLVLYAETLLAVLLLARRDSALHRWALGGALVAGSALLLAATSHVATGHPATLYRDALLLAVAGAASLVFVQVNFKQLAHSPKSLIPNAPSELQHTLLLGFAALAGLLQAGTGVVLARVVFGWHGPPVALLLGVLVLLAGAALAGALWVRASGQAPAWVHRQQLVISQYFVVLAIFGLHELGLSWLGVVLVLYAENLLVALLLSGHDEDGLLHTQTYLLVLQAALLPLLGRYLSPGVVGPLGRAALLVGTALLTLAYQLRRHYWRRAQEEFARLALGATYQLPLLGLAVGWLLLGAGALVYVRPWAGWVAVGLLGSLLYLRQRVATPGLWAGLALAAFGYMALQWSSPVLWPSPMSTLLDQSAYYAWPKGVSFYKLLYLLPTAAVPLVGLATSWWPAMGRYVRWPWLYLPGAHLAVAVMATATLLASFMLGLLGLAVVAFAAAQQWRRTLPDAAAVARAGQPDRYLLHVAYALLMGSFVLHLGIPIWNETFFHQPAEYFTAGALFGALVLLAVARPPAAEPVPKSWRWLHRWLPEAALLFGSATLAANIRTPWQPLIWVGGALVLSYFGPALPLRFRRLGVYGRLYYGLAAVAASAASLRYVSPGYILRPEWWALVAAVALLFGYVTLTLRKGAADIDGLSPRWDALARPPRRTLEAWLLYPAFLALSLLLIQSFDRSVLTVLLMLEVVAVFSTSLLLRRQDLRYLSLAGMLGCLVRLVFFDLSRSGTITRAIVFIFMGLLLLGMNALYARFKARFAGPAAPDEEAGNRLDETETDDSGDPTDADPQTVLP